MTKAQINIINADKRAIVIAALEQKKGKEGANE